MKLPSFSLKNPWHLALGLGVGVSAYFILKGMTTPTGFAPYDTGITTIGTDLGIEGIFKDKAPVALKDAPGKTTVVQTTPLAGQSTGLYQGVYSNVAFDESRRLSIA